MKLRAITLTNFRAHSGPTTIPLDDFTAFIGKNDFGKSSVLEALEIFFNNDICQIEKDDLCKSGADSTIDIGCIFGDLPESLVLDSDAQTTLKQEYLLNSDGNLEIHKKWDCTKSKLAENVYIVAQHPSAPEHLVDLLQLKNAQLKQRYKDVPSPAPLANLSENPSIRKAIRDGFQRQIKLDRMELDLGKDNLKEVWNMLQIHLPLFALFKADRAGRDEDAEAQDTMRLAVKSVLAGVELQRTLRDVETNVKTAIAEVAKLTIQKLKELNPETTLRLTASFDKPKWEGLFKPSLEDDQGILINKRGSGFRRLLLLSFLRADAERRAKEDDREQTIFAIEEPETSQHPDFQMMLVKTLFRLTGDGGTQIIITTHNPSLTGILPVEALRWVYKDGNGAVRVEAGSDEVFKAIAGSLGVLPDSRVRVFIGVEGKNDVHFLKELSVIVNQSRPELPNLHSCPFVAFLPQGGSNLKDWLENNHLKDFDKNECCLYDRDKDAKYGMVVAAINAKGAGHYARLTGPKAIENYLHPDAIQEAYASHNIAITVVFGQDDDVPALVAEAVHAQSDSPIEWANLKPENQGKKISHAKVILNEDAVKRMTIERLQQSDPNGDLIGWLEKLQEIIAIDQVGLAQHA